MKKNKMRILALVIVLAMSLGMIAACGPANTPAPAPEAPAPEEPEAPEAPEEPNPETTDADAEDAANGVCNLDLIDPAFGRDWGFGPVGFDLEGIIDRIGREEVANMRIGIAASQQSANWHIMWAEHFRDLSDEFGFEVIILSADGDPVKQAEDLRSFMVQQVDGIIVFASHADAVAMPITEVYNSGIPIISAIPLGEGGMANGFINVSQFDKGVMIADRVAEDAAGEDRIIMLMDSANDIPILRTRIDGFTARVEEAHPNLHIVDERRETTDDGWLNVAREGLLANEDINTIVATFAPPMMGGWNAATQLGRDLYIYGVDADEATLELLRDGELMGIHVQWPQVQAETCLFKLFRVLSGEQNIPFETWEPENYAMSYARQEDAENILGLLFPDRFY